MSKKGRSFDTLGSPESPPPPDDEERAVIEAALDALGLVGTRVQITSLRVVYASGRCSGGQMMRDALLLA